MLADPAIGLSHKHKIRCNFFRPFAVVTNATGVSHYTQSPGVLAAWVGHLYYLWSPSRDPRTPSGPVSVRRCHCWWPKVDGNSASSAKGHSQVSELLGTLEGWSLTFKPVHGTADTDWISILKYIILTLIQEHNVLSAHDWFTVSCTSHTHAAPQAAAGATNA